MRIGIGIGGLALALRRRGLAADVYEQASELPEIGAAVALSGNANREFERLGLLDAIAAHACEPSELIWRGWADGRRAAGFPPPRLLVADLADRTCLTITWTRRTQSATR